MGVNRAGDGPLLILLVEDNPGDVRLVSEALGRRGDPVAELEVVEDGEEALERVRASDRSRPDIVMLDLNLPRKDGRGVLRELKRDPDLRRIPVIVFTSSATERDVLDCYDLHANCYVVKPIVLDDPMSTVEDVVRFWLHTTLLPPR